MERVMILVRNIAESILDSILPLRARAARAKELKPEDMPLSPTSHDLLGTRITTLMDYQNKPVADVIQSLKYDGSGYAAHLCASALADYLREEIASHKLFSQKKVLLVPVPLHPSRMRERGFNQIAVVLNALPPEFRDGGISKMVPNALVRTRATGQQTRLSRSERLRNVADAFAVSDAKNMRDAHIFLIDDVTTTGATLSHAARPLRKAGASVSLLALARA